MLTQEQAKKIARKIFSYAKAGGGNRQAEVFINEHTNALTRFANNVITQNVHTDQLISVTLRVIHNGKTARVSTNQLDDKSLKSLVERAFELAQHQKKDPKMLGLTTPQKYQPIDKYSEYTASLSPQDRLAAVRVAVDKCASENLLGSGTFTNSSGVFILANSKGLFAFHKGSSAQFALTVINGDATGWASDVSYDAKQIDLPAITQIAIDKAVKGSDLADIPSGRYTVILEPAATGGLLGLMAGIGFGALRYHEGRSFLSGKLGKKIMSDKITIVDDAYHSLSQGMPFDFEGVPKKKIVLIDQGVARNIVYDRETAKKAKTQSTGHALPQPNAIGPVPTNMIMQPGKNSLSEMIKSTKRGILVTQFHYTNVLEPMKLLLTGLTRNGTFLIENGNITKGVKNMRFTESVVNAFSNVEMISKDLKCQHAFFGGGFVTPALKIKDFNFSSKTGF